MVSTVAHAAIISTHAAIISTIEETTVVKPPVFDLPILPEQPLQRLLQVQDLHALADLDRFAVSADETLYSLYPAEAGQSWTIELYDISKAIIKTNSQTRLLCVVEGTTAITVNAHEKQLGPGHAVRINPNSTYSLNPPHTGCRFLLLTLPALPEYEPTETTPEIFVDVTAPEIQSQVGTLQEKYFKETCIQGANAAYDLIPGKTVGGRYNVALQDIVSGRKHYHEQETERRVVLDGPNLEVELSGNQYSLTQGQMCRISPGVVHRFKSQGFKSQDSSTMRPTRLLAINIPAYNPDNVIVVA